MSSLNPYAASYVPLSFHEAKDKNKACNASKITFEDSKDVNETAWTKSPFECHEEAKKIKLPNESFVDHNIHGDEELAAENFKQKGCQNTGSHYSSSQHPSGMTEKHKVDANYEMDLAHLEAYFPGLSAQSLLDVYLANEGDLEASIDMLDQLEFGPVDIPQQLPDTLGIGDVPEPGTSTEGPSTKLKQISDEASGSSSGSSELVHGLTKL